MKPENPNLIYPQPFKISADDVESNDVWGFKDTHFAINERGHAVIEGERYELSGQELTRLLPWIRETIDIELDPKDVYQSNYPTKIPAPFANAAFTDEIGDFLSANQLSFDGEIRLRHGHGHTQEEMFAIKYGKLARIPDLVVYPESEVQIAKLIESAKRH